MSDNEKSKFSKFNKNNYKDEDDESLVPDFIKLKSVYERNRTKIDQQKENSLSKKKTFNEINSFQRAATPKKLNNYDISQEKNEKTIERNTVPLMKLVENENTDTDIFNEDVNYTGNSEEEDYTIKNHLKRKFEDNQEYNESGEEEEEEHNFDKSEKKMRLNNNSEDENINNKNLSEIQYDSTNDNEEEIENNDNESSKEMEENSTYEKKLLNSSSTSASEIVDEPGLELESESQLESQSELESESVNKFKPSSEEMFEKSIYSTNSKRFKKFNYSDSEKEKSSLNKSKNSSNATINSDPTNSSSTRSFFGFKRFYSRKNSKTEESCKSDETPYKRKGSSSSSNNKFTSFFRKSNSKKEEESIEQNPKISSSSDSDDSSVGGENIKNSNANSNSNFNSNSNNNNNNNNNNNGDQFSTKRVPKRKRNSSSDDEENANEIEIERQKVKKMRLLEEEIKTIQHSIELKQKELLMQYDNLIKTRNSLSDPTSEPLPDFIPLSSIDYNSIPPPLNIPRLNRPSVSSNFSRPGYYDYPYDVHSYPGDYDYQNTSFASNSDFRHFNNPRMTSPKKMNIDNNGRYSNSGNLGYPSSSMNYGPDEPSFYSNYSFNGNGNLNRNPNSNMNNNMNPNLNPNVDPRILNGSYNTSFYSKFGDPNLSQAQSGFPNQSFTSPTNTQPSKGGFFSFFRRRKGKSSDPNYPMSNSLNPSPNFYDQSHNPITNISSSDSKKSNLISQTMDVSLTKPFYYYFIPLTRRKVKVHVDPLLRNAINYAKAAGNFECLKYLCEFEKIPNKYIDLRSIEEAAAHNDIEELKCLLKHSWFYDTKCYFILLIKIIFLTTIFGLILYCFNGLNEILIAFFITYIAICIIYNWINRE